ncbi:glycosyltransferase [Parasalinivibrio latis]|uniref:glycosyltransferase n=1 Tax=Parasalinivibrio latis TaxID=2952610 RepID=UPI0030E31A59
MKIGVMCKYPWFLAYGGAEVQAEKYVQYCKSMGLDIEFVEHYDNKKKYDILHFVGVDRSTENYALSAKQKGVKTVLSPVFYLPESSVFKHQIYRKIFGKTYKTLESIENCLTVCDKLLPNSKEEEKQLGKIFGPKIEDKCHVIHNGFDTLNYKKDGDISLGVSRYMLCVAAIEWRKNTLNMLKAYNLSEKKFPLVLIGDFRGGDKIYESNVKIEIEKSNGSVIHIPFTSDRVLIESYYKNAFAHILPSYVETPGISNLEAAYFDNYLIVGDSNPVREYFSGFDVSYVSPDDIKDISEKMELTYSRFIEDGLNKHHGIDKYHWRTVTKELMKIYRSCM